MKIVRRILLAAVMVMATQIVTAQNIGELLKGIGGGGSTGDIISNVIEGVFTKTNLSLADLVGEYKSQGPAVTFKSDNFLQKAGGIAGAAAIEAKLNPYYEQYGLNNMTLTVDQDAQFKMTIKGISLSGTITKNENEGTFEFNFKVVGFNLGKFTAYIEKSGSNLNLMFDATKLKSFISTVAKFTGNSLASTVGSILDSYEGACIGFKMVSISSTAQTQNSAAQDNTQQQDSTSSGSSIVDQGLDALKGIFNKK